LAEGGGLKENSIWERPKGNNDIVDLRGAWTRPAELYSFLRDTYGFRESALFEEWIGADSSYHQYWDRSIAPRETDLTLPLRDNQYWASFLPKIQAETKKGDLVFFEDWHLDGWTHVGIITHSFTSPTYGGYGNKASYSLDEPLMIDHHGKTSLEDLTGHQRSISDTNSIYIRRVRILHAPW
jgi:hypothetical protein